VDRGAKRVEARGGRVLDAPVGLERRLALGEEVLERRERAEELRQVGKLGVLDGDGDARALGALDEEEEVEEVLGAERAVRRAEPRDERRAFVHARERDRGAHGAAALEVARDAEAPRDLERVGGRRRAEKAGTAPLRRTKAPGEPKHAGPVEFGVSLGGRHGPGIYIPVRRSSASLRSIFLRAAMALRFRLAEGFS
jgi:hypothetical protein